MKGRLSHIFSYLLVILFISVGCVHPESSSEHEDGKPYDFSYAVKDDVGNDFGHEAKSDGNIVIGEYRTLLPDGRVQIVRYQADWKTGYKAEVTYSGVPNWKKEMPINPEAEAPPRVGSFAPGKQICSDDTVGVNCNPASSIEDTKAEADF